MADEKGDGAPSDTPVGADQGALGQPQPEAAPVRMEDIGRLVNGALRQQGKTVAEHLEKLESQLQALDARLPAPPPATGGKPKSESSKDGPDLATTVEEMRRQVTALSTALEQERTGRASDQRSLALREALSSRVLPEALQTALRAFPFAEQLRAIKGEDGSNKWVVEVRDPQTDIAVEKPLDEVVGQFIDQNDYLAPPSGTSGSGSTNLSRLLPGSRGMNLADLSPEEKLAMAKQIPAEQRKALLGRPASAKTGLWGRGL